MPTSKTSLLTDILATGFDPWTDDTRLLSTRDTTSRLQTNAREALHDDAATEDAPARKSLTEDSKPAPDDGAADPATGAANVESGTGVPAPTDITTVMTGFWPLSALDEAPVFTPPPGGMQTMANDDLIAEPWQGSDTLQPLGNGGLTIGYWDGPLLPLSISLVGTEGDDALHGGEGDDTILDHANGLYWVYDTDSLYGHGGDDLIIAGFGDDLLDGGDGNDELYGGWGDDSLIGGNGFDRLYGGGSNDMLESGPGGSVMYGEDGNDSIIGGDGYDWVRGGSHDDYIDGGAGNDMLWGDDADSAAPVHGEDIIVGGEGDDSLFGHGGDDVLEGGEGRDWLEGWTGNDILLGGNGNDMLIGGSLIGHAAGSDVLDGGAGDDFLLGNTGSNVMTGGSGADVFLCAIQAVYGEAFTLPASFVHNTVTDYDAAEDKVQGFSAAQVGTATHVYSDTSQLLFVLLGHDLAAEGIDLVW